MRYFTAALILLMSCSPEPEYVYVDNSLDFFLDKWWALGDNRLFEGDTCFYLDTKTNKLYQAWEGEGVGYEMADWEMREDHILVLDFNGYDAELSPHGSCGDFMLSAKVMSMSEETNLYKCDF